ncbi:MAG: hypothetical protein HOV82_00930 [Streptomyces sp.]|nr:hypothetical protein [Streptomyces sp.]NUR66954.1 hypothetical protein [Streptomyces sp.]NUS75926.1 hypothetical protein [Streptomyces sp.]
MACPQCSRVLQVLDRFPAGDTRGDLKASHIAAEARQNGQPAHVHYSPTRDEYVVVIGEQR